MNSQTGPQLNGMVVLAKCAPKVRLKFLAMVDSGRVLAMRSRSDLSRWRRFMILWVSWPWNEGPLDLGLLLLFSVDEKRPGAIRRERHVDRRAAAPAPAPIGAVKRCPRPLGILPASRDMACIGMCIDMCRGQLASGSELEASSAACRVVGCRFRRWSGVVEPSAKV